MKKLFKQFLENITEEDKENGYKRQVDFLDELLRTSAKEGMKNGFKIGFEIGSGNEISEKDFSEGFGSVIDESFIRYEE